MAFRYINPVVGNSYTLNIGDELRLHESLWSGYHIWYAGMTDENRFSLIANERDFMSKHMHGNLYFSTDLEKIILNDKELEILDVNPNSIQLKYAQDLNPENI